MRFPILLLAVWPVLLLSARPATAAAPAERPNIVFILADDLGYAHLGCYGQKIIQTPNLDRLAAEGMRFTQAYAGCSVCAPSRSVLMTGYPMGHTSVRANTGGIPLRDEDVTIAEVLRAAGYTCGGFGKWGLGDAGTPGVPTRQGFAEFFGYLHQVHAHSYYPPYLWHNDRKHPLPGNSGNDRGLTGERRGQYSHDEIAAKALDFIKRHKDRPFFCYVPFTIPHVEILAPESAVKPYRGKFMETPFVDPRKHYADQPTPRAVFAGMISHLDHSVGRIGDLVKELGLDRRTVIIFTSDNGAQGGAGTDPQFFNATGPLRGFKGSLYEGGIRVPFIVRWPGAVKPGAVSEHVCSFADVLPTLAELAGAEPPKGIDGVSFVPVLRGAKQKPHAYLYWELQQFNAKMGFIPNTLTQAVRVGDWKAVRPQGGGPLELYDLSRDIGESKNVAAEHPDVVAKIEAILKTCRTEPRPQREPEKPAGKLFQ
jgi:uncharacterized sulfatase